MGRRDKSTVQALEMSFFMEQCMIRRDRIRNKIIGDDVGGGGGHSRSS